MPSVQQLSEICIPIVNQPAYTKRKLRVATIGAGYSGLILAHKIQHEQPDLQEFVEHVIYESNDGVGGTWKVNTYPGVQCDVPAHIYAFPFDPNPNWSQFYADGHEILEYMEKICDKWNLRRDIKFNTKVLDLDWQADDGLWHIKLLSDGQERNETADIVISATGILSAWKWPDIVGLHEFKGHKVHSASWGEEYDYSNKRIGIIGNGSSGIQILPCLAKLPGTEILSLQRGPTWVTPSLGETLFGSDQSDNSTKDFNPKYSDEDKKRFQDPAEHLAYRKKLQHGMNKGVRIFAKNSAHNQRATKATIERMRKALNYDEDLCQKLIPSYNLGCRRLTPGEGYLESFLRPNVSLTNSPILKITETGIQTDTDFHELDVIVCATGFDVSNIPRYPVNGKNGMTLAEKWKDEPESYLSLACPDFPNYFIFTGPNATVGHGSIIQSMNWSADWMIKWFRKMSSEGIKSIAPKQSATDEFVRYGDEVHKTLAWTGGCRSWYKNHRVDGRVTALWGGSALLYKQVIQEIRPEDFEIEYLYKNRFAFLGNGFTEREELDEDADLAWFLTK